MATFRVAYVERYTIEVEAETPEEALRQAEASVEESGLDEFESAGAWWEGAEPVDPASAEAAESEDGPECESD